MKPSKTRSNSVYHTLNPEGDPFRYTPEKDPLLEVIGLVLWITEGDKTQLSLSNGNPTIIQQYLNFLRIVCNLNEKKIKAVIHCHDTLPYTRCIQYWSELTNIPHSRFNKPYIKRDSGGTRKYPYGILRIAVSNVRLQQLFKDRLLTLGLVRD